MSARKPLRKKCMPSRVMEAKLATTLVHSVGAPDSDADDGSAFRDLSDVVRDSSDGERWDWISQVVDGSRGEDCDRDPREENSVLSSAVIESG